VKWRKTIALALGIALAGCTVTIAPIQTKRPAKKQKITNRTRKFRPSPTPTATVAPKEKPIMHLEPTEHPTPMIKIPPLPPGVTLMEWLEAAS